MFGMYPFLMKLYADGGYQGPLFRRAVAKIMARVNVEIVKRSDHAKGFVVLPKRWVVERTFAWLGRCRRLAKDWENLNRKALAFLRLASIRIMLRKTMQSRMISPDKLLGLMIGRNHIANIALLPYLASVHPHALVAPSLTDCHAMRGKDQNTSLIDE